MKACYETRIVLYTLLLACLLGQGTIHAQNLVVVAASPAVVEKGSVNLDVTISGEDFEVNSQAAFVVSGTSEAGGITVNSTQFNNPNELVANISIDECANTGDFDIKVLATNTGRRGKGNTLMSVLSASIEVGSPCATEDSNTAAFSGDVEAGVMGAFIEESDFDSLEGHLTGNEEVILTGDAAMVLMYFDDVCRLSRVDSALCSSGASEKGVLPLGIQRLPFDCGQPATPACNAVRFDASTGLEWNIRFDHDPQAVDRVQLELEWNNENGEGHSLRVGSEDEAGSLSHSGLDELSGTNSNLLKSATIGFVAYPFSLEGDLLIGTDKQTEDFVYSDYGEDGTVTFIIEIIVH